MALYDSLIKHQIMLERLKLGRATMFNRYLLEIDEELRRKLAFSKYSDLGGLTKKALRELVKELKESYSVTFNKYIAEFVRWLESFMKVDREIFGAIYSEHSGLEDSPRRLEQAAPIPLLWARSMAAPLAANGMLPKVFLIAFTLSAQTALQNAVTQAWVNKENTEQLITKISGTKERGNRDGILNRLYNQSNAVTDTLIQHIAVQTNVAIASKFFDEYEWLSILDNKTTVICWNRDGNRYRYGKGPLPPAHIRCRSDVAPVIDGKPMPQESFADWLRTQKAEMKAQGPLTTEEFKAKKSIIIA